jgi:hypothetical protein
MFLKSLWLKTKTKKELITTFQVVIIAIYSALTFALQVALAGLPNIELVTLMLTLAAVVFPWWMSFMISITFSMLEILIFGTGQWIVLYLVVWNVLVLITFLFKKFIKRFWWIVIIIDGLFGFTFGMYDSGVFYLMNGFNFPATIVYYTKGVVFDLIHGVSNTAVAAILFRPFYNLLTKRFAKFIR